MTTTRSIDDILKLILKTILYPRKSREDIEREKETGEDCLAPMTEMLVNACRKFGIAFDEDDIMPEVGSADTIEGRPVFSKIIYELIPSGKYNAITVREISRLGRGNFTDAGIIYDAIVNYKVFIITPHKIYDPQNKMDLKMLRWELFQAREEYETTKDRLWEYRNAKAQKGFAPGGPSPYGYTSIRGKYIVIPEEAEIVRKVFELRAQEISQREIARLISQNHKTRHGKNFIKSTIVKILNNKRYVGVAVWLGEEYESKAPAIIPIELWNKVHLEVNPELTHRPVFPRDNEYLVELYCHDCGYRMYGCLDHSSKVLSNGIKKVYNSYPVYNCEGRKRKRAICYNSQKLADNVHHRIFTELKNILHNKKTLRLLAEERQGKIGYDTIYLEKRISEVQKLIKQKEAFMSKLDNDYAAGDLTAVLYSKHFGQIETELESYRRTIVKLQSQLRDSSVKISPPEEILSKLELYLNSWDDLSNRQKKCIIKDFFPRIEIASSGDYYITRILPSTLGF